MNTATDERGKGGVPTRVLVTGGTGFIGSALVTALSEAGVEVAVQTRDAQRARGLLPSAVTLVARAADCPWRPQAVVNLAGAGIADRPWTRGRRQLLRDSRIAFTRDLLADLAEIGMPDALVSASAVGVYGDTGDAVVDEDCAPGPGFAAELCRDWEAAASEAEQTGVRVVLARIGLVLGPGGLLGRLKLPFSLGLGGRLGDGRQYMPWIHRDDVVGLLVHALGRPDLAGPLNLTAPEPVTNAEFTRALARVLQRPAVLPAPAPLLRMLLGDMARELLLAGQRTSAARALASGYRFRHAELDGALRAALG